jgi:PAS domain S-box-containing protein
MKRKIQPISGKEQTEIANKKYIPTNNFYSHVIESIEDYAVLTLDLNLSINSWNAGAANIFQYDEDEIIGQHFNTIFTNQDIEQGIPEKEIRLALKNGRATDNRWHQCKDNGKIYASGLVFPLMSDEEEHIGYVKILQNKTENKKTEDAIKKYVKELEDLDLHKDNVLAILSHDLRSPLAATIAASSYLKTYYDTIIDEERKEIIGHIYTSSVDELNMLDYLLEWARVKYASQAFTPKEVFLLPLVTKIVAGMQDQAADKSLQFKNEIQEDVFVFADPKMLLSIFQNLIANAIHHTPEKGTITVKTKRQSDSIIVEIQDTGNGMSPDMVATIFTPRMESLSKPRKETKGGGIGLLLVNGFVEKNKGKIWVESMEKKGTSFFFTLPLEKSSNKTRPK